MEYNRYVKIWQDNLTQRGRDIGSSGADGKFGPKTLASSLGLLEIKPEPAPEPAPEPEPQPQPKTKKAICTANSFVNVRAGRGEDYREFADIGNVYAGQIVEVFDEDLNREYIEIAWDKGKGYAYCSDGAYFSYCEDVPVCNNEKVLAMLAVVKEIATPIDGQNAKYVFGGEGNKITRSYITSRNKAHPEYFSNGRLAMLLGIADECEKKKEWVYPIHYAWDCSGLWWYGANKAKLYGNRKVDSTAAGVYANYCSRIEKRELAPGDLVFYKSRSAGRIVHMGVVGEAGIVYEAMSGYTGVIIGDSVDDRTAAYLPGTHKAGQMLKRSAWTHFGRPKVFA